MNSSITMNPHGGPSRRLWSQSILFLIFLLVSGCSSFNKGALTDLFKPNNDLIDLAYMMAEDLESQAYPPLLPRHQDMPILTTTFVNNENLQETSQLGRVLQEHLTSRFVQLGYTVREVKMGQELHVEPLTGEKILSRNLYDLQPHHTAQAVAVGTYSVADHVVYITARLIDPFNATIVASVDYKLAMDETMMAMFGLQPKNRELLDPVEEPRPSFMTRLLY